MTKGTIVRDNEGDRREGTDREEGEGRGRRGRRPHNLLAHRPRVRLLCSRPNMQDIQNERILKAKE